MENNTLYICMNDEVLEGHQEVDDQRLDDVITHKSMVAHIIQLGYAERFSVEYVTSFSRWHALVSQAKPVHFDNLLVNALTYDQSLVDSERVRQAMISDLRSGDRNGVYTDEDNYIEDNQLMTTDEATEMISSLEYLSSLTLERFERPCDNCKVMVSTDDYCGDDMNDGSSEYLCEDCYGR